VGRAVRGGAGPIRHAHLVRPERVYRFYRGGALIDRLRGEAEQDNELPEDWVASVTRASNPGRDEPDAGLARLADGRLLRDAVAEDPVHWGTPQVLVKLLDPANRLPVHAHPSRAFAREHLGSEFGKTEAWIFVDAREGESEAWLGLKEAVEPEQYREWLERQDVEALLGSLNRITVKPGDVLFVPAGVPHAIGGGALIVELQEPTDFSIVCEWKGFPISADDAHLGLGWDVALRALDLSPFTPSLGLPPEAREFFQVDDRAEPAGRFAVLLVLEGEGAIDGQPARAGDAFVLPAGSESLDVRGDLRVLRCLGGTP
jgi:mannose-6-phosphate isomerase